MKKQSAKRKRCDDDDGDGSEIGIDRLSQLPEPMLHQILSLISQRDAVQTCVLSKSWRYLGITRPKLEFSEGCYPWKGKLISVVDKLLKRYHDQNLSIQEFLLDVPGVQSGICSYLEKWISMLISLGGLKTFNLKFLSATYALPQVVFLAESLQELNLYGCSLNKISSAQKVMFKNLQALSLRFVSIEEETFENIMSGCPLIQCLVIHKCKGLRTIKVSNAHNLKNFDCDSNYVIHREYPDLPLQVWVCPSIEINAPTLQTVRIGDCHNWYWHHNNKFFPNLKSVHMYKVRLPTESFDIFSSYNSPCLEDLELSDCSGFKEIELSSISIKHLVIFTSQYDWWSSMSAAIDTPNILYFKFSLPSYTVPSPFSFTKTSSCEWKSDISVCCNLHNGNVLSTWLPKLNVLLKALSQSQISMAITCLCYINQHIEDTYEGFNEPVVVEHLSLSGSFSSSVFPVFINYLFSICRPRYINDSQIAWRNIEGKKIGCESLCKVLIQERERTDSLWQQDLEDISTEELNDAEDDDGEEWLHFLDSSLSKKNIRLRLKWKE